MSSRFSLSSQQARDLFQSAAAANLPASAPPIDMEHLALLASGRINEIPAAKRDLLLRQIAASPWAAELLLDLQKHPLEESGSRMRIVAPPKFFIVSLSLAAAVLVSLVIWRSIEPPPTPQAQSKIHALSNPDGPYMAPSSPSGSESGTTPAKYWDERDRQHLPAASEMDAVRDYAICFLSIICLLLSLPVFYWAFQRLKGHTGLPQ